MYLPPPPPQVGQLGEAGVQTLWLLNTRAQMLETYRVFCGPGSHMSFIARQLPTPLWVWCAAYVLLESLVSVSIMKI